MILPSGPPFQSLSPAKILPSSAAYWLPPSPPPPPDPHLRIHPAHHQCSQCCRKLLWSVPKPGMTPLQETHHHMSCPVLFLESLPGTAISDTLSFFHFSVIFIADQCTLLLLLLLLLLIQEKWYACNDIVTYSVCNVMESARICKSASSNGHETYTCALRTNTWPPHTISSFHNRLCSPSAVPVMLVS